MLICLSVLLFKVVSSIFSDVFNSMYWRCLSIFLYWIRDILTVFFFCWMRLTPWDSTWLWVLRIRQHFGLICTQHLRENFLNGQTFINDTVIGFNRNKLNTFYVWHLQSNQWYDSLRLIDSSKVFAL